MSSPRRVIIFAGAPGNGRDEMIQQLKGLATFGYHHLFAGAPGNGRDEMIQQLEGLATFGYHHLFEYIVEEAKLDGTHLTKINILDFYDSQPSRGSTMRSTRQAAST